MILVPNHGMSRRPITGWRVEEALLVQLLSTKKARIVQIGDTRMKLSQIVKGSV